MKFLMLFVWVCLFAVSVFGQTGAEIIVPATFLRKSPSPVGEKVLSLNRGEKLVLERAQDDNGWYYVSLMNGRTKGWVNGNTIRTFAASSSADSDVREESGSDQPRPARPDDRANREPVRKPPAPASGVAAAAAVPRAGPPAITPPAAETRSAGPPAAPNSPKTTTAMPGGTGRALPSASSAVAAAAAEETKKDDEEVLRVETEEVTLNVRVVDANNRPVQNLNRSHFEVYENDVRQPLTSLTTAEVPINYALLVDNSRSLRSQLGKIAEAGKIIFGTNRPADESTVVRFVSRDKIEVIQDFTTDKRRLDEALDGLFIEGGQTAIVDAVYLTARRVEQYKKSRGRDDPRRRALILVSDGEDRGSARSEQQLFDLLRSSDVQVYAIGFTNDLTDQPAFGERQSRREKARAFLTRVAAETGGKVYFPDSVEELPRIANDISAELRTQYLLTYAPAGERRQQQQPGGFRNIKVVVSEGANKEKRIAVTRQGRTAAAAAGGGQKP